MPKFLTYQRPAPVAKQNWNKAPGPRVPIPRKTPEQQKPAAPAIQVPALDQLIRRD